MSARFRQMKFLHSLNLDLDEIQFHQQAPCCLSSLDEDDLEMVEQCRGTEPALDETELVSLYYVCGYVAMKENIPSDADTPPVDAEASDFTDLVSRGRLRHPPEWLFYFSQLAFHLFRLSRHSCANQMTKMMSELYRQLSFADIRAPEGITRRLTNVFYKGLAKMVTEGQIRPPPSLALNERKRRKFS